MGSVVVLVGYVSLRQGTVKSAFRRQDAIRRILRCQSYIHMGERLSVLPSVGRD